MSFSLSQLASLTASFKASAGVQMGELGVSLYAGGAYNDTLTLYKSPIVYGTTITIAGQSMSFGLMGTISAVIEVAQSEAAAKVALGFSQQVQLEADVSSSNKSATVTVTRNTGLVQPFATFATSGNVGATVGLKVAASVEFGSLAMIEVYLQPTIGGNAKFSYPAFEPVTARSALVDTSALCSQYHLLEYDAEFNLPVGADVTVSGTPYGVQAQVIPQVDIAQGCLFNLTEADPLRSIVLKFAKNVTDMIQGLGEKTLSWGIADEFAAALKISPTSIVITIGATGKSVEATVVEADASAAADLIGRLESQAGYSDSMLWGQPLMAQMQSSYQDSTTSSASSVVATALVAVLAALALFL